jgi:hypothetical protein
MPASLRVRFHDTVVEYETLAALNCTGDVMVARVPHALECHYVQHYQHEQSLIEVKFLVECGAESVQLLTAEQQEQLAKRRSSRRYVCHHSTEWQDFALHTSKASNAYNHIYSVMPTGMAGFLDAMAAVKHRLQAAGGR